MIEAANLRGLGTSFTFVTPSRAVRYKETDNWTAALEEVANGWLDVAPADFWPTASRREKIAFTSPVKYDHFWLLVPAPAGSHDDDEKGFIKEMIKGFGRCFNPFSPSLWLAIVAATVVVGCLQVRVS
eukprot:68356-Prymnesium_polylepis.1